MTTKTTLSFTERHHAYLIRKVGEGDFASQSAAVAVALEQMMRDEERDLALAALTDMIHERLKTPLAKYVDAEQAFGAARARIAAASRSRAGRSGSIRTLPMISTGLPSGSGTMPVRPRPTGSLTRSRV